MYFINYAFLCLFVGVYVYFQMTGAPVPAFWNTARVWASWVFLLWAGFEAGRVILDSILTNLKGEMSTANMLNGMLMVVLNILPILLMSFFLLKEGYAGK
jgi:hypothetical protein